MRYRATELFLHGFLTLDYTEWYICKFYWIIKTYPLHDDIGKCMVTHMLMKYDKKRNIS